MAAEGKTNSLGSEFDEWDGQTNYSYISLHLMDRLIVSKT
jgi:hypothetical protein